MEKDYFIVHMETAMKALREDINTGTMFFLLNCVVSDDECCKEVNGDAVHLKAGELVVKSYRELSEMLYKIAQGWNFSKPRYVYLLLKRLERKGYITIKSFDGYKRISLKCFEELRANGPRVLI